MSKGRGRRSRVERYEEINRLVSASTHDAFTKCPYCPLMNSNEETGETLELGVTNRRANSPCRHLLWLEVYGVESFPQNEIEKPVDAFGFHEASLWCEHVLVGNRQDYLWQFVMSPGDKRRVPKVPYFVLESESTVHDSTRSNYLIEINTFALFSADPLAFVQRASILIEKLCPVSIDEDDD